MEIVNVPSVKAYSKVRLLESMVELRIALEMLKEGYTRNFTQKVFLAWKAIISALVSLNLDKLGKNEKEKEWYKKSGFSAPTTRLKLISNDLEKIGYDEVSKA